MEQFLENDPEVRMLQEQQINWLQQRSVEAGKPSAGQLMVLRDIDTRLETIAKQLKDKERRIA